MMRIIHRLMQLGFAGLICIGLGGCYDLNSVPPANIVVATVVPYNAYDIKIGFSTRITVNFTTNDLDTASNLQMSLLTLPADWTASASSAFTCQIIPASGGSGCSLTLIFKPNIVVSNMQLSLPYTYTTNNGQSDHGTLIIPYSSAFLNAYLLSGTNNMVSRCPVNSDGTFASCTSNPINIISPIDLAFYSALNGATYAYISSYNLFGDSSLKKCTLNTDGTFSDCTSTASGVSASGYTVFQKIDNQFYAYIANGGINQCKIDGAGNLYDCTTTATGIPNAYKIAFSISGSSTAYAYITSTYPGAVYKCLLNAGDGRLSACAATGNGYIFVYPHGIALQRMGDQTYVYISNYTNATVNKCTLNSANGELFSCAATGNGYAFFYPEDIAFNTAANGTSYAYITNANAVAKCAINAADGELYSCAPTGNALANPRGIAFY